MIFICFSLSVGDGAAEKSRGERTLAALPPVPPAIHRWRLEGRGQGESSWRTVCGRQALRPSGSHGRQRFLRPLR